MILKNMFARVHVPLLKNALDAASLRQKVIASNLANVETPNYVRKKVVFESELQKVVGQEKDLAIRTTNPEHISEGGLPPEKVQPKVVVDKSGGKASGVNNVDVDEEMASLAKNQLYYAFTSKMMATQFNWLKKAINERAR